MQFKKPSLAVTLAGALCLSGCVTPATDANGVPVAREQPEQITGSNIARRSGNNGEAKKVSREGIEDAMRSLPPVRGGAGN